MMQKKLDAMVDRKTVRDKERRIEAEAQKEVVHLHVPPRQAHEYTQKNISEHLACIL